MTASTTKDNGSTTFELMKLKELKENGRYLQGIITAPEKEVELKIKIFAKSSD
jgi:hypothetical protein